MGQLGTVYEFQGFWSRALGDLGFREPLRASPSEAIVSVRNIPIVRVLVKEFKLSYHNRDL